MKDHPAFPQLFARVSAVVKSYRGDLERIDRQALAEANPETPFLHYAGEYGTVLVFLPPADHYPPHGKRVPHLFGTADRWDLVRQAGSFPEYIRDHDAHHSAVVHYWTGRTLREIDKARAATIARDYARGMRRRFHAEEREYLAVSA